MLNNLKESFPDSFQSLHFSQGYCTVPPHPVHAPPQPYQTVCNSHIILDLPTRVIIHPFSPSWMCPLWMCSLWMCSLWICPLWMCPLSIWPLHGHGHLGSNQMLKNVEFLNQKKKMLRKKSKKKMTKNKTILSQNWSFRAKNWPKIAKKKKKLVKSLSLKPKLGQKWQKTRLF